MIQKKELAESLEGSLKVLEAALAEREEEFRALLYECNVSDINQIDDIEMYRLGAELDDQIDRLRDLIDELKWQLKHIAGFKEV